MRGKISFWRTALLISAALSAISPISWGQATSGILSGVVQDQSQAVIVGATVMATNTETGATRTAVTNSAGRYRVGELMPGTYQLAVSMEGFRREVRREIVLQVGQELTLSFSLQVGEVEQQVEVTAEVPIVDTTTAVVSAVVSQEQLRELPLNGRSFTDLITLDTMANTPTNQNSASTGNYGAGKQLTVAGARSDANSFTLDGTDMNATSNNTPGSAAGVQLGVDAIREFQVITANAKAEYGRSSGAVVNAVTRSGTNDLHGSLFEFLRNNALDARRFIDLPTSTNPEGKLPPFKRNQFGGTVGGPVRPDTSFYFLAYEGLRQRLTEIQVRRVPTAAGRQGAVPAVVQYLNLWPFPTPGGRDFGDGTADYFDSVSQPTNENFGQARYDHHLSENDFLFGRYTISRGDTVLPGAFLATTGFETVNQYLTLQYDRIMGAALLNMFRAGYNRSYSNVEPNQVAGGENLGFTPGQPMGALSPSPLTGIGPAGIVKLYQVQNAFQFDDNMTWTRGNHTLKFGASVTRFQWNTDQPAFIQGSISFNNLANFRTLAGGAGATFLLPESSTFRHLRTSLLGFFAQDDWRVSSRLTVNYGLRWEFTTGLKEIDDLVSWIPDPLKTPLSGVKVGELWDNKIKNFQPRLGVNWALDENSNTVLSGGFGIFQNQALHNSMVSFRAQLPFYFRGSFSNMSATATSNFPNIRGMIAATANGADQPTAAAFRVTRSFDHDNFKIPTFYRYNLTIQRNLPGQMAARVGYVGSVTRHLARRQSLNTFPQPVKQSDGSLLFPPSSVAPQFTNPEFSQIEWMSSDANSSYNALNANLQKRFSHGLTYQASYTYSKCIDDASSSETNYTTAATTGQWSPDRSLETARCNFNVPHSFVANGLYELPFGVGKAFMNSDGVSDIILGGWQIGGVVTIQQGTPFTVTTNFSTTGYAFNANRPNVAPGVDIKEATKGSFGNRVQYFDPSAFVARPPAGTIGNASRNILLGPPIVQTNFTLSKSFSLTEQANLQFRSEFFNVFNQTNLSFPASNVNVAAGLGRINDTSTKARQIQLALKLTF
ncbi:MAG: TonB-dependent receptor [Acidobacteria bacterium]|nr:TonB-dependent receptor [Acidobacteriota bacterium]